MFNNRPPLADRTHRLTSKGAFDIWEKALALEAQGVDIIHLEVGEPDFATPPHIIAAAEAALQNGRTHYTLSTGEAALRQAIAAEAGAARGVAIDPTGVLVTPGVKGALYFTLSAVINAGDEVIVPSPYYPIYAGIVDYLGGRLTPYELSAADGWQIDGDRLASHVTPRTRAILLNLPHNPTGAILSSGSLDAVAAVAQRHNLWVLSDEVYSAITFTGAPIDSIYTRPGLADRTILMDGLSKRYAMTGWRVGYGIFPQPLRQPVAAMMVNTHSCLPPFIQDAATAALTGDQSQVAKMVAVYKQRRDDVVAQLAHCPGVAFTIPDGAFYILLDVGAGGVAAGALAERLMQAGVALLPVGERHLRLTLTRPAAELRTGIERLTAVLRPLLTPDAR